MQTTIIENFDRILRTCPSKTALTEGAQRVSFSELAGMSMHIKHDFLSKTYTNGIIAVILPKSINLVASDIAILASGAAFMNIDYKLPETRLSAILDHIAPDLIITNESLADKHAESLASREVVVLPATVDCSEMPWTVNKETLIDTDPFCIINTSGSTGIPKGVILNQKSFMDFLAWSDEEFHFNGDEIIGSLSPVCFDIYVFELCLMLTKGSSIVLIDGKYSTFPLELLNILKNENVNFIFWVPTIMVNIANMDLLSQVDLSSLKNVWFAGEVFPTKQFNYWFDHLPRTCFSNLYGPIEITLDCTYYTVRERLNDDEPIPIGIPCRNTDILILDDNRACGTNEKGELCVRGTSLAMGYYNDPERTQKAFTQNPLNTKYPETIYRTGDIVYRREDGNIIFCGRKDSLIKHLGYRIELGEIEHLLINNLKLVSNCCAVYSKEKKEIVLYYESDTEKDSKVFMRELSKIVPKYMIPKIYIPMNPLPQNTNGKIDRLALEKMTL